MKRIIFLLLVVFILSSTAVAQLRSTAFPFYRQTTNVKSLSLGNATVSLSDTYSDPKINPAGFGMYKTVQLSWYSEEFYLGWKLSRISGNYRIDNSALAVSIQKYQAGEMYLIGYPPVVPFRLSDKELYLNAAFSHTFSNSLQAGFAINYASIGSASGTSIRPQKLNASRSIHVDLGIRYQMDNIYTKSLDIAPQFGFSLTNFGEPVEYLGKNKDPLPATLRLGAGVKISTNKKLFERPLAEMTILQSASKILARKERVVTSTDTSYQAMGPLESLFNSWGSFEYFNGWRTVNVKPAEQIWFQTGIELGFLETIFIRFGHERADKTVDRISFNAIGAGLDFYYLAVDYGYVQMIDDEYINYDPYESFLSKHHWQITGRIPLDGNRPETIIHHLFK